MKTIIKEHQQTDKQQEYYLELLSLGFSEIISKLLSNRFITDEDHINNTKLPLINFSNLSDIDKAVNILAESIRLNQRITVVADYDADGATACAVMVRGLRMFGANVNFFVPNRFKHGYGLTVDVVKEVIEHQNPELIVTVDNGISSHEGVEYCNENKIKVLITDHHISPDVLPNAAAIVNPNKKNCSFSSKNLAGCGVAFYLLMALKNYYLSLNLQVGSAPIFKLIDIVSLGTIADVVKLDANNRKIVNFGLKNIREGNCHCGIKSLIKFSGKLMSNITSTDISFSIAPKLNAAGRLDDMSLGIQLLLSDDPFNTDKIAEQLRDLNLQRKSIEIDMVEEANFIVEPTDTSIITHSENFHEGVIGIVASRLKEQSNLPTIVFSSTEAQNVIKGSGRSIAGIHLRDIIDYVHKKDPSIIIKFGGHSMAAGLSIYQDKLELFKKIFDEGIKSLNLTSDFFNKTITYDTKISIRDIDSHLINFVENQPWGQFYTVPTFCADVEILNQTLLQNKHLKFTVKQQGVYMDAIWFNHPELINSTTKSIVFQISVNRFRNTEKTQLLILESF